MQALLPQEDRKALGALVVLSPSLSFANSEFTFANNLRLNSRRDPRERSRCLFGETTGLQRPGCRIKSRFVGRGSAAPWSARPAGGYNPASKIAGPLYGHGRPPRPGDLGSGLYVCFVPVCLHGFAFQGDCAPGVSKILVRGVFW
jgi:hypothetical protein